MLLKLQGLPVPCRVAPDPPAWHPRAPGPQGLSPTLLNSSPVAQQLRAYWKQEARERTWVSGVGQAPRTPTDSALSLGPRGVRASKASPHVPGCLHRAPIGSQLSPGFWSPAPRAAQCQAQTLPSVGSKSLPQPLVARKQQTMTDTSGASGACPPATVFLCLCSGWSSWGPECEGWGVPPHFTCQEPRGERSGWGGAGWALAVGWGEQGCFTWVLNLTQIQCLFPGSPAGRMSMPGRMGPEAASSVPPRLQGEFLKLALGRLGSELSVWG